MGLLGVTTLPFGAPPKLYKEGQNCRVHMHVDTLRFSTLHSPGTQPFRNPVSAAARSRPENFLSHCIQPLCRAHTFTPLLTHIQ